VTGKKETLNNHILRVKFLLDAFIPGTNEDKVNATLSDLVATLDKQPERLVTLGDSIALKSKYANPGVWMLTAKPQ
jgi:hypothetical protein